MPKLLNIFIHCCSKQTKLSNQVRFGNTATFLPLTACALLAKALSWTRAIFIITTLACSAALADTPPSAGDVEILSIASSAAFDTFITETFSRRHHIEYSGGVIDPNDAQEITNSAKRAGSAMDVILKSQIRLRLQIENYEGNDWDKLYGKTSLWRTSVAAARQTRWRLCIVDYYHAIASTGQKKRKLLEKVIAQTGIKSEFPPNEKELLNIRATRANDAETNTNDAIRRLDALIASSGIDNSIFYRAVILRMKLSGRISSENLNSLAGSLKNSKLKKNFELLFTLAMEELKAGGDNIIVSISAEHPAAAEIAGRIILKDIAAGLSNQQSIDMTLKKINPAQARLAAFTAVNEKNSQLGDLFSQMCRIEKFQSPAVYLAAAESSRKTRPVKAVEYYLQAVNKTKAGENRWGKISPAQIAARRARFAYGLYYDDSKFLTTAADAIELYLRLADVSSLENTAEYRELAYMYASMNLKAGNDKKALELLKSIAVSTGKYSDQAELDLLLYRAENSRPRSAERKELIDKLKKFMHKLITANNDNEDIAGQAKRLYCKLLVEEGGQQNARIVLEILKNIPNGRSPGNIILKAAALAETGNLVKAVNTLAPITDMQTAKGRALAAAIITEILDNIDEYEDAVEDFQDFTGKCRKLAHYSSGSIKSERHIEEYEKRYIEIAIIDAAKGSERLTVVESLLNEHTRGKDSDIDWMRCRGRLYMKQGRYAEAFPIWSAIAQARKPRSRSTDKPAKWFRAKYYALKSYANISPKNKNELKRAIDILLKTNKSIPETWENKLKALKKSD